DHDWNCARNRRWVVACPAEGSRIIFSICAHECRVARIQFLAYRTPPSHGRTLGPIARRAGPSKGTHSECWAPGFTSGFRPGKLVSPGGVLFASRLDEQTCFFDRRRE